MHTTNPILHQSEIDVIALEAKHQKDYERLLDEQEFSKNYKDKPYITFEDEKYDGELDIEPEPYQWFHPSYRKGYLAGVTKSFNEHSLRNSRVLKDYVSEGVNRSVLKDTAPHKTVGNPLGQIGAGSHRLSIN